MCFSGPDMPPPPAVIAPPPPVASPEQADKAIRTAQADDQKQARLRKGRQATMITGSAGVLGSAPVQKKSLLGL